MSKEDEIMKLREIISNCKNYCENCCPELVNPFYLENTPPPETIGYWNDAFKNYNAKLMIVGQDWGSEGYLEKWIKKNGGKVPNPYDESNPTFRNLMYHLEKAKIDKKDIYLTNAVLCLREGNEISGNKNKPKKKHFRNCSQFLKRQIEIIQPKIIATLGLDALNIILEIFEIPKKVKKLNEVAGKIIVEKSKVFPDIKIFPLFHTGIKGINMRKKLSKNDNMLMEDFKELKRCLEET
ncbi:uracil-DNA glycosylase family protein [Thermodesulfovibrio yellowstonii]|uniref:uracil-DNA glycosylase family protein n=1 Tax=Thermodesulfovibrio yellowstonii TaxID=28262 RepID=UPI003C7A3CDA